MDEKILTKEEYTEKVNSLVKPMVEFAMSTQEFNYKGCYSQEFVKVGDKEVTLAVVDDNWVIVKKYDWEDRRQFKERYYELKKEFDKLLIDAISSSRKKFLGIFNTYNTY